MKPPCPCTLALLVAGTLCWNACRGPRDPAADTSRTARPQPEDSSLAFLAEPLTSAPEAGAIAVGVLTPALLAREVAEGGLTSHTRQRQRVEARAAEIQTGLPRLTPGMTVDDIGRLLPTVFDRPTRKALRRTPDFTALVGHYRLHFQQGILVSLTPPPPAPVPAATPAGPQRSVPEILVADPPAKPPGLPAAPAVPSIWPERKTLPSSPAQPPVPEVVPD